MLAKPSAVVVPFVVLIIEWLVLRRGLREAIVGPALWFLFALPVVIVGMLVQRASLPFVPPLWARPVVALDALAFYLIKLVAPLQLSIDYGRSPQWLWSSWQIWVTWAIPVVVALIALWIVWRWKFVLIAAGLAVMAVALLPVLGFVPFDFQSYSTTADHYLYFAMLGPAMLVAAVVHRWMKRAVIGTVVVWIMFLALQSHLQSWVWHDSQSLFQHTVDTNPTSLVGLVNLGKYYADQGPQLARQGMYQAAEQSLRQAITYYEKAVRYWPNDAQAREGLANTHATLGWVVAMQGRLDPAIAEFETALKLDPNNADAAKLLAQAKAVKEKKSSQTQPIR
jgi:protein O-mannosyl-transferase